MFKKYGKYALLLLAVAGAGLLIRFAIQEHLARAKAEATIKAKDQEIASRDAENVKNRQELQKKIDELPSHPEKAKEVIRTVFVKAQEGEKSPQVDIREVEKKDLPQEVTEGLPDAPEAKFGLLSPSQLVILAKRELACQQTEGDLKTCKADLATKDQQIQALKEELKGGTKFHRFGKISKCLAVGAGGAAIGALADKNNRALGAAIGSFGAGATCQIFF